MSDSLHVTGFNRIAPTGIGQDAQHVRGDDTGIYLHKGDFRFGEAAMEARQSICEIATEFLKQTIAGFCGGGVSDDVFFHPITEETRKDYPSIPDTTTKRNYERISQINMIEPTINAKSATQNPSMITINQSAKNDGSYSWRVCFELPEAAKKSGWIIQEINSVDNGGSGCTAHFWEAWPVEAGKKQTVNYKPEGT